MPDGSELTDRVFRFARQHRLFPEGGNVVAAVSGGPDSVCMLHMLLALRNELSLSIHVAHLDHGLRGAESAADARYVADLCRRRGLPFTVEQDDVSEYRDSHRLSPEEAAREVRYRFLSNVAGEVGADRVAMGHTMDDHIETVLMHLIRGSGTRGLRGLLPVSRLSIAGSRITSVRPLLEVTREETAGYCRRFDLQPRLDASNLSLSPLRNRIRQHLIPLLAQYNPRIAEALCRTARIAAEDFSFLEIETERVWGRLVREEANGMSLSRKGFLALPVALQRHLLRAAVEAMLGNLKDIESTHIEEVIRALDRPAGKRITLPDGLNFIIDYDRFLLSPETAPVSPLPALDEEVALNVPGETGLAGWRVLASEMDASDMRDDGDEFTAYLDLEKAGRELTLRQRRPGDRFQPLGMNEVKKVNEFMIDSKIPRSWRERVPLVCSPQHIVWVVGWRIDERARVTASTGKVLRLEVVRDGSRKDGAGGGNRGKTETGAV
jgi:tRNA(Ile)-lysidine synthase